VSAAVPNITVRRSESPRAGQIDNAAEIAFSSIFCDHMLVATYSEGRWLEASIQEYGPLSLPPNISALQYGLSVFEGLKAHRTVNGQVALFRPGANAARLNRSAERLAMPAVPEALFLDGLRQLVRLDQQWVPPTDRGALYVRPCLFSIDPSVRVKAPDRCVFVIFTFPFTHYYAGPVDLQVSERYVRAFPGGTGEIKPAGNYAPTLLAEREARENGFHSVLWLDGQQRSFIEECGVMNVFFAMGDVIVTPALEGTILPGITRDSAITLLREIGLTVVERPISIDEVFAAHEAGALRECFGTGTAATVSTVRRIGYQNREIQLATDDETSIGARLRERLTTIATGRTADAHNWLDFV
jgi:branched-chain amino acid aminotransferase